jgi:hypothetical protein
MRKFHVKPLVFPCGVVFDSRRLHHPVQGKQQLSRTAVRQLWLQLFPVVPVKATFGQPT